jgi:hypothetical protein
MTALSSEFEPDWVVGSGTEEIVHRDPVRGSNFGVERERRAGREQKYVRANSDWGEYRCPGNYVVQGAGQMPRIEANAYLLVRLPDRGRQEISIPQFPPAARQRHVPTPGIARPLGPANQEDAVGLGSQHNRDGGPEQRFIVIYGRMVLGQTLAQASKAGGQCECDWQPPPQQPPPGGGPRRL